MNDLAFSKVTDALLSVLPEFQDRYRRELSWWQGPEPPGQYTVFGFVAKPIVRELLSSDTEPALLKRIFDFFEEMARSSDIEVPNLLQIEIFEWLVGDPGRLATGWKYMGEKSKALACSMARIRHCEQNLPRSESVP
jgi:hypothetical protein